MGAAPGQYLDRGKFPERPDLASERKIPAGTQTPHRTAFLTTRSFTSAVFCMGQLVSIIYSPYQPRGAVGAASSGHGEASEAF